jgi:hypothetical protein
LKIYCLNGEWRKDGTFVIIVSLLTVIWKSAGYFDGIE